MGSFIVDMIDEDGQAWLSPAETRHLMDVLRHRPGDEVEIRDKEHRRFRARLLRREGPRAVLTVLSQATRSTHASLPEITLYQGILKGKRMDILVEKATELGASRIVPMLTQRTIVRMDTTFTQKRRRWLRKVQSALKQCGRCGGIEIAEPLAFDEFLSHVDHYDLVCIATLSEDAHPLAQALRAARDAHRLAFVIGPEGDFTTQELEDAHSAGCIPVSLGPHVLRGETAAIAALAGVLYEWTSS